ncbi:hypothetical protein LPJ69_001511 [Coemansia sp. RSA 1752]|nr:hypothetical protein LPJ69_001511 [Coemansia sp. RSA 1752]
MAAQIKDTFLNYCEAKDRPKIRAALQQDLVQQLEVLRLQLSHQHSAYECAKAYPEIGPLLTTLSRSRAVAYSSNISRATIDAAMEYSKIECTGVYANQRAQTWFSQLVRSFICTVSNKHNHVYELPDYVLVADEVSSRQYALRQLIKLLSEECKKWEAATRERVWNDAFALCCSVDSAELLEYLLPVLDECGWQQLQRHELLQDYSVYVLARLPADDAQRLWSRLEVVRAQLVLHLLREQESDGEALADTDSSKIHQLLGDILANPALAEQMVGDIAQLVWTTRSTRVVDMWKRICTDVREGIGQTRVLEDSTGEGVAELFSRVGESEQEASNISLKQTRLWRQWCCVAAARRQPPVAMLSVWLRVVASAGDGFAFATLDRHFDAAKTAASKGPAEVSSDFCLKLRQNRRFSKYVD